MCHALRTREKQHKRKTEKKTKNKKPRERERETLAIFQVFLFTIGVPRVTPANIALAIIYPVLVNERPRLDRKFRLELD